MNTITVWLVVILLAFPTAAYIAWAWSLKRIHVKEAFVRVMERAIRSLLRSLRSFPWIGVAMVGVVVVLLAILLYFLVVFIY